MSIDSKKYIKKILLKIKCPPSLKVDIYYFTLITGSTI